MTDLFMSDLFVITNTKDRPCAHPYISPPPPLYKLIKNHLRKYISPGLIVGGLRYCNSRLARLHADNTKTFLLERKHFRKDFHGHMHGCVFNFSSRVTILVFALMRMNANLVLHLLRTFQYANIYANLLRIYK